MSRCPSESCVCTTRRGIIAIFFFYGRCLRVPHRRRLVGTTQQEERFEIGACSYHRTSRRPRNVFIRKVRIASWLSTMFWWGEQVCTSPGGFVHMRTSTLNLGFIFKNMRADQTLTLSLTLTLTYASFSTEVRICGCIESRGLSGVSHQPLVGMYVCVPGVTNRGLRHVEISQDWGRLCKGGSKVSALLTLLLLVGEDSLLLLLSYKLALTGSITVVNYSTVLIKTI